MSTNETETEYSPTLSEIDRPDEIRLGDEITNNGIVCRVVKKDLTSVVLCPNSLPGNCDKCTAKLLCGFPVFRIAAD